MTHRRLVMAVWVTLLLPALVSGDGRDVILTANDVPDNPNAAFGISVDVDRPDRRYGVGDGLTIEILTERSCYVTIFDVGTSGNVTVLLPNRFRENNRMPANQAVRFPSGGDGFSYTIGPPGGTERIVVIATTQDIDLTPGDLCNYQSARSLFMTADAEDGRALMARARDVLIGATGNEWASDQVTFQIVTGVDLPPQLPQPPQPGTDPGPGQAWAFIAAVADYPGDLNDLTYTDDDAQLFAQVLEATLGIPSSNIRMAIDGGASLQGFADGIDWLATNAGRNDVAYIFFSGHGTHQPDDNGDEDDGQDEFICLHDGNLRDDDYYLWVKRIKSGRLIEITDTCFSGGSARGVKSIAPISRGFNDRLTDGLELFEGGTRAREIAPEGICLLAASRPDQTSQESASLRQGVFTHFLAEGLRGAADANGDGVITVQEIFDYTSREVASHTSDGQQPYLLPATVGFPFTP